MTWSYPVDPYWMVALKALLVVVGLLTAFAFMTLIERRLLARFQVRMGPNRVGPFGLLQPLADAIKSIFKEDIVVAQADRFLFVLAPLISVVFALLAFGLIPFGPPGSFFGYQPWVINLDLGILYLFAVSELAVYGIFLSGWASGSKYSLLGSLRSSASLISYELGLGLAVAHRFEDPGHALGIRLVHLAAEGGDPVAAAPALRRHRCGGCAELCRRHRSSFRSRRSCWWQLGCTRASLNTAPSGHAPSPASLPPE